MIHRFVDFFSSGRVKRDGEKELVISESFHKSDVEPTRSLTGEVQLHQTSKPSFKDAEEGIDVRKIQDHIKSHKKHGLTNLIDWNYIKIYKEFKKILKEEIK